MSIIKSNISQMWHANHSFFIVVVLVQVIAAFSVLYVTGAIANDYFSLNEDAQTNLTIYVNFNEGPEGGDMVSYAEIKDTLFEICNNIIPGAIDDMGFILAYEEYDDISTTITSTFSIEGDRYCMSDVIIESLGGVIMEGRLFTEDELNGGGYYALVGSCDSDELIIKNKNFDILGEFYSIAAHPEIIITPYVLEVLDLTVRGGGISLNRIITDTEFAEVEALFEESVPGRYEISTFTSTDEDKNAILRTALVTSCLIGLSVLAVLIIVYGYVINLRKKNLAIWRLTGCTAIKAALLFFTEMAIISAPSVLLGFIAFYFTQKTWLNVLYPYMTVTHTPELYVGLYLVIMLVLFVLFAGISLVNSRYSVKQQLIRADI